MSGFELNMGRFKRRIYGMVSRAVLSAVDDSTGIQALQIEGMADELHDGVERMQDYGFTSHPKAGAEATVVFAGGLRSHGLIVALGDRRFRLKDLTEGEVAMYDDQGQVVRLKRDGVFVHTDKKVTIEAGEDILVHGDAKITVEAVGDVLVDGEAKITVDGAGDVLVKSDAKVTVQGGGDVLVDSAAKVTVQGGGNVLISSDSKVTVQAPIAVIDSADVRLGGSAGGLKVARVGDSVDLSTGLILTGSDKVKAS